MVLTENALLLRFVVLWLHCKVSMSEEATEETEKAVRPNDSPRRKSCTTDGFLAPSGELDFDLPVQQGDLSGLIGYGIVCLFLLIL